MSTVVLSPSPSTKERSKSASSDDRAAPSCRELAYLTTEYPKVSHTFIRREIVELERRGLRVLRLAIRNSGGVIRDAADRDEASLTYTCLDQPIRSLLRAFAATVLRRPRAASRAAAMALAMSRRSDRGVIRHMAYLVEACLLREVLERNGIRHVHVHFGTNAAAVARLIRCLGGPSYSITIHGPDEFDAPVGFSLARKVADAAFVVAISDFCAAQIRRWTPWACWDRIHIVHCTVGEEFLTEPEPIAADADTFLCIGRLSAQKGQLLLIDAMAELVASGASSRLVLAGDGEMREIIEQRIEATGLRDHVEITGWIDERTVRRHLADCRALVQPSFAEGLPVVMMEALARARPVIATVINGVPELVRHGENGWLVTAGNQAELVDAMRQALACPAKKLNAMGRRGRERVVARHRTETEVERLAALFARYAAGKDAAEMCGIAGAVGPIGAEAVDMVRRIDAAQVHRGPDDAGAWHTGADGIPGCAMAHRRLAIIDLDPGAAQPMRDPESGAVIVFNGEIFNFRALRETLATGGTTFRTAGDTEVILHAYRRWGTACVEHLRGQFAFMLWDPETRRVLIARDRLGIKPLYWTVVPHDGADVLLVASELRSLLAAGVPRRLDPVGLATYLWNGFVVGPGTIVKGVQQLPAGSTAVIDPDDPRVEPRRYWLPPEDAAGTRHPDELRAALRDAVRLRLVSDVPLGVFLSGGVDSSAVAALAARALDAPIRTFTVGFDEARYDESGPARAVAEALGTDHLAVRLSSGMFLESLPSALAGLDQPTFDAVNTYVVSRAVREAGLTVALAGTGGDELFGGYRSFVDVPRAARAARFLRGVPPRLVHAGAGAVARQRMGPFGSVPPQTRWGKLGDALVTGGDLVGAYQAAYGLYAREFLAELLGDGTDHATVHGLPAARAEGLGRLVRGSGPLHAVSLLELSSFIGQRLLRDTDSAAMSVSLEVRVPLLDHEVIEIVAGLGTADRFEPLGTKTMLRRAALEGLDPRIFDRPKQGFELPFDAWCRGPLRPAMEELFEDPAACTAVGVDPNAVRRLWAAFLERAPGIYWSRVWALYVLLWWCREHGVER